MSCIAVEWCWGEINHKRQQQKNEYGMNLRKWGIISNFLRFGNDVTVM